MDSEILTWRVLLNVLEREYPRWFTIMELCELTNCCYPNVNTKLRRMRKKGVVEWRREDVYAPFRKEIIFYRFLKEKRRSLV